MDPSNYEESSIINLADDEAEQMYRETADQMQQIHEAENTKQCQATEEHLSTSLHDESQDAEPVEQTEPAECVDSDTAQVACVDTEPSHLHETSAAMHSSIDTLQDMKQNDDHITRQTTQSHDEADNESEEEAKNQAPMKSNRKKKANPLLAGYKKRRKPKKKPKKSAPSAEVSEPVVKLMPDGSVELTLEAGSNHSTYLSEEATAPDSQASAEEESSQNQSLAAEDQDMDGFCSSSDDEKTKREYCEVDEKQLDAELEEGNADDDDSDEQGSASDAGSVDLLDWMSKASSLSYQPVVNLTDCLEFPGYFGIDKLYIEAYLEMVNAISGIEYESDKDLTPSQDSSIDISECQDTDDTIPLMDTENVNNEPECDEEAMSADKETNAAGHVTDLVMDEFQADNNTLTPKEPAEAKTNDIEDDLIIQTLMMKKAVAGSTEFAATLQKTIDFLLSQKEATKNSSEASQENPSLISSVNADTAKDENEPDKSGDDKAIEEAAQGGSDESAAQAGHLSHTDNDSAPTEKQGDPDLSMEIVETLDLRTEISSEISTKGEATEFIVINDETNNSAKLINPISGSDKTKAKLDRNHSAEKSGAAWKEDNNTDETRATRHLKPNESSGDEQEDGEDLDETVSYDIDQTQSIVDIFDMSPTKAPVTADSLSKTVDNVINKAYPVVVSVENETVVNNEPLDSMKDIPTSNHELLQKSVSSEVNDSDEYLYGSNGLEKELLQETNTEPDSGVLGHVVSNQLVDRSHERLEDQDHHQEAKELDQIYQAAESTGQHSSHLPLDLARRAHREHANTSSAVQDGDKPHIKRQRNTDYEGDTLYMKSKTSAQNIHKKNENNQRRSNQCHGNVKSLFSERITVSFWNEDQDDESDGDVSSRSVEVVSRKEYHDRETSAEVSQRGHRKRERSHSRRHTHSDDDSPERQEFSDEGEVDSDSNARHRKHKHRHYRKSNKNDNRNHTDDDKTRHSKKRRTEAHYTENSESDADVRILNDKRMQLLKELENMSSDSQHAASPKDTESSPLPRKRHIHSSGELPKFQQGAELREKLNKKRIESEMRDSSRERKSYDSHRKYQSKSHRYESRERQRDSRSPYSRESHEREKKYDSHLQRKGKPFHKYENKKSSRFAEELRPISDPYADFVPSEDDKFDSYTKHRARSPPEDKSYDKHKVSKSGSRHVEVTGRDFKDIYRTNDSHRGNSHPKDDMNAVSQRRSETQSSSYLDEVNDFLATLRRKEAEDKLAAEHNTSDHSDEESSAPAQVTQEMVREFMDMVEKMPRVARKRRRKSFRLNWESKSLLLSSSANPDDLLVHERKKIRTRETRKIRKIWENYTSKNSKDYVPVEERRRLNKELTDVSIEYKKQASQLASFRCNLNLGGFIDQDIVKKINQQTQTVNLLLLEKEMIEDKIGVDPETILFGNLDQKVRISELNVCFTT